MTSERKSYSLLQSQLVLPKASCPSKSPKQFDLPGLERFICAIANNTWRLCKKKNGPVGDAYRERPVNGLLDALSELGVHIKDHDGELYDVGMAVNVIAWEKSPHVHQEKIIETIKPSIRWHDKLLQWGDVIVCLPDTEDKLGEMEGAD